MSVAVICFLLYKIYQKLGALKLMDFKGRESPYINLLVNFNCLKYKPFCKHLIFVCGKYQLIVEKCKLFVKNKNFVEKINYLWSI